MLSWTVWSGFFSKSTHYGGTWMQAPGREARQHEAEQQDQTKLRVAHADHRTLASTGTASADTGTIVTWASTGTAAAAGPPAWVSAEIFPGTAVRTAAGRTCMRATWPAAGIVGTIAWATAGTVGLIIGGTLGVTRDTTGVGAGV